MKKATTLTLILLSHFSVVSAQNPPALTTNAAAYNFALSIIGNFNAGRRFEETNQGLATGSLGNMTLPSDYANLTSAQKALYIINAERTCRNGIQYSSGKAALLPFQGVETNLNDVSQAHANWLVAQNKFDHCGDPSFGTDCSSVFSSPTKRIQGHSAIKDGWERTEENIGIVLSSDPNSVVFSVANEKIIFDMIYRNAPNWAHRANFLRTFMDNFGATAQEGFIGVGEKKAAGYNPFNSAGMTAGKVLVYQMYDPAANATNSFSILSTNIDSSKCYRIVAKHNNKALTVVNNSQSLGAAIVQATAANLSSQKWILVPTSDGYYKIKSLLTGQAMDIRWGVARQGARVNQWTYDVSSKSQEWKLIPSSNGCFQIINRNSKHALSVPIFLNTENFQLVQLNTLSQANQLWQLVEVSAN